MSDKTADINLLNEHAVAEALGVAPATVRAWRRHGSGPPHIKIGPRLVRYSALGLREWLRSQAGDSSPSRPATD